MTLTTSTDTNFEADGRVNVLKPRSLSYLCIRRDVYTLDLYNGDNDPQSYLYTGNLESIILSQWANIRHYAEIKTPVRRFVSRGHGITVNRKQREQIDVRSFNLERFRTVDGIAECWASMGAQYYAENKHSGDHSSRIFMWAKLRA